MSHRSLSPFVLAATLCFVPLARPAVAQVTPPPASVVTAPLPIALPDGAKLKTEVDGTDADVLGLVKGLLQGIAGPEASDVPAKSGARTATPPPSSMSGDGFLQLLTDPRLTALLKDVHHIHFVAYTTPWTAASVPEGIDLLAFYETPFQAAGGHRVIYQAGNSQYPEKDPRFLLEGFPPGQGFAAILDSGKNVYVVRADGYPDMKVMGSIVSMFFGINSSPEETKPVEIVPAPKATKVMASPSVSGKAAPVKKAPKKP